MRRYGRRVVLLTILVLLVTLVGCQSLIAPTRGPAKEQQPPVGMNLVGNWDYWMRSDMPGTYIVRGTLVIREESCLRDTDSCVISGYLEFGTAKDANRYAISGFSYPKDQLVRFSYDAKSIGGDPERAIVEFDSFPNTVQRGTMVGDIIMFSLQAPGAEWTDSIALRAAGRGITTMAGRVSAWPSH